MGEPNEEGGDAASGVMRHEMRLVMGINAGEGW